MKNEKLLSILKNREVVAGICTALLLLIAAIILVVTLSLKEEPIVLSGSFTAGVGEDVNAESTYVFDGNFATRTYNNGTEDVTDEYTYEIDKKGENYTITLTRVDKTEEKTYSFAIESDLDGNITAVIINTIWYYKD